MKKNLRLLVGISFFFFSVIDVQGAWMVHAEEYPSSSTSVEKLDEQNIEKRWETSQEEQLPSSENTKDTPTATEQTTENQAGVSSNHSEGITSTTETKESITEKVDTDESAMAETSTPLEEQEETEESLVDSDAASSNKTKAMESESREMSGEWRLIDTPDELVAALAESPPPQKIRLKPGGLFNMANKRAAVKSSVEIDGNGRTISYNNFSLDYGIYAAASNLTVKLSNMVFGSPDFSVPMNNLYGLFPAASNEDVQLYLENVRYYSNNGAQAFHLNAPGSAIYFSGTNEFVLTGAGEEFAQADRFHFLPDSQTTIRQTTNSADAFIWSYYSGLTEFDVGENALVDVETNHCFFYNQNRSEAGSLMLADQAQVKIRSINARSATAKNFLLNDSRWDIMVGEQASLDIDYPHSIALSNNSRVTAGPQSSMRFSVTEAESVFDRNVGASSKLTIDNASFVEFSAKAGNTYNPIGFSGGTDQLEFASFTPPTEGYSIQTDQAQVISSQKGAGFWNITSGLISRQATTETNEFTAEEKTALQRASLIRLIRIPEPRAVIRSLKKTVGDTTITAGLEDYQINGNPVSQITYRLFSQSVTDPDATTNLIEEKTIGTAEDTVTFENLSEDTDYWVYAKIECRPESQSSDWYGEQIHTLQLLSVEFPLSVAFMTVDGAGGQKVIPRSAYQIRNKSSFEVAIEIEGFKPITTEGIQLLEEANTGEEGLFLQLVNQQAECFTLADAMQRQLFTTLPAKASENISLDGFYRGRLPQSVNVEYELTLSAKKAEEP